MALDIARLKNKIAQIRKEKPVVDKKVSAIWTPSLDKDKNEANYKVFCVPWSLDDSYPFKERWFYYELGGLAYEDNGKKRWTKAPLTLKQFGEADPVKELVDALLADKDSKSEEEAKKDFEAAKVFFGGQTCYIPVIIEGEEALGVRLWKFTSKAIYERITELFIRFQEQGIELNNPKTGRWLTVKVLREKGKPVPMDKKVYPPDVDMFNTKNLTNDDEQIEKWMNEIPDLEVELKYNKVDYDGMKKLLDLYANSGKEKEEVVAPAADESEKEEEVSLPKEEKKKTKTTSKKMSAEEASDALSKFMEDDD